MLETDQNNFGGDWTQQKIQIIASYTKAYLTIMSKHKYKLLYFDGFAGSGEIETANKEFIEGAALKILSIDKPRGFDIYYFVEIVPKYAESLKKVIKDRYGETKKTFVECKDFTKKIDDLADYLDKPENRHIRVLAFVDPKGMQVKWKSIQRLKGYHIDLWILVPLGIGWNRMLEKNGNIPEDWVNTLEASLGMSKKEIFDYFYQEPQPTLFGDIITTKHKKPIELAAKLYSERLSQIFEHVSKPFVMRNSKKSPMYHFYLVSNNKTAVKIANELMIKYI